MGASDPSRHIHRALLNLPILHSYKSLCDEPLSQAHNA
jgi:hypothetical protein